MSQQAKLKPPKPRRTDGHKGTYGKVLVIAGSQQMPGAAVLAALGALRGGAGLVSVATPHSALPLIAPAVTCATFLPLPETHRGNLNSVGFRQILAQAERSDAVVLGPGLGTAPATVRLVRRLVKTLEQPLILDADGLNAIAGEPACVTHRSALTVMTPHPGELCRLDGQPTPSNARERKRRAESAATQFQAVVCLKGHRSVVTDGQKTYVNQTGNPGMGTGGSGDVLSGLIGALLSQFDAPLDAAIFGVHVHGLAGDLAADYNGPIAMIASDLLDTLGPAIEITIGDR